MQAHKLDSISQVQVNNNKRTECTQNLKICELVYHLNHGAGEWMFQERRLIVDDWTLFSAPLIRCFLKVETLGQGCENCALPGGPVIGKIKLDQRRCLF